MAVFKCKMCGGSLEVTEGMTVCECEYCGTKQTLPKTDNEQTLNMFNRANHFRQQCEFDKAAEIYERMTAQRDDAELYWSIVLCRYGIEYVDDPLTKKKIPTCHRTQYKSILEDADYLEALSHADSVQKEVYKQEAEYIDKVQKGILEISNKEKPFDVFICYKETDDMGRRTPDSVLAQELYYGLTKEGFKVFFSRITLESKLGTEYEPYIFAALNSAKVMVVVGTKPEYFNAVWVRNEWSRYLMLMQEDRSRTLIPAYKDMDPYDLPDALSMFQAQDMSKLGFMQDLIHGIKKIVSTDEPKKEVVKKTVVRTSSSNIENLIKRGNLALEDGKWDDAKGFFDQVLNEDVEEHRAYIGFLCAEYWCINEQALEHVNYDFTQSDYYKKACRFGGEDVQNRLYGHFLQGRYEHASYLLSTAQTVDDCVKAKEIFEWLGDFADAPQKVAESIDKCKNIIYRIIETKLGRIQNEKIYNTAAKEYELLGDYLDSKEKAAKCRELAKECRYNDAMMPLKIDSSKGTTNTIAILKESKKVFEGLGDFKDSKEQIKNCEKKITEIKERLQKEKEAEEKARKRKKKKRIIMSASIASVAVLTAIAVLFVTVFLPMIRYSNARKLLNDKKYDEAIEAFEKMNDYKDSQEMVSESKYKKALSLKEEGLYEEACDILSGLNDYKESKSEFNNMKQAIQKKENDENEYKKAVEEISEKKYNSAIIRLKSLNDYKDSKTLIAQAEASEKEEVYTTAVEYLNKNEYGIAIAKLNGILEFKDSKALMEKAQKDYYDLAEKKAQEKDYAGAFEIYSFLGEYKDSKSKAETIQKMLDTEAQKSVEKPIVDLAKQNRYQDALKLAKSQNISFSDALKNNGLGAQLEKFEQHFDSCSGAYRTDEKYPSFLGNYWWKGLYIYSNDWTLTVIEYGTSKEIAKIAYPFILGTITTSSGLTIIPGVSITYNGYVYKYQGAQWKWE